MKKTLKWIAIFVCAILVIDGISSFFEEDAEPIPEKLNLTIETSEVYGKNNDVFSVIPGSYSVCYQQGSILLKVGLKLNKTIDNNYKINGPILRLKNEMGANVADSDYDSSLSLGLSERNKMLSFLHSKPGSEQSFIFSNSYPHYARTIMTQSRGFTIEDLELTDPKEEVKTENTPQTLKEVVNEVKKEATQDKEIDQAVDDVEKALKLSEKAFEFTKSTLELTKEIQELQE